MRILLHVCCAPCSVKCTESLAAEGKTPVLYWFNPNIHPFTEYKNRRDALLLFAKIEGLEVALDGESYGLRPFLNAVHDAFEARCDICYRLRLDAAARYAAANGYDGFSTTLLISPYQQHERLRALGEQAANTHGVTFLYRDFRPLFRAGQQMAKERGLYRQKYCGCIFSEEERYNRKDF